MRECGPWQIFPRINRLRKETRYEVSLKAVCFSDFSRGFGGACVGNEETGDGA